MNFRISNNLFEAIQNITHPTVDAVKENAGTAVDKAHFCATHVEHSLLGQGVCISEQHAEPDENGNIAWYSVQFPSGIQRVNASNLKIVEGKSHTHGKKMAEEEEEHEEEVVEEAAKQNMSRAAKGNEKYGKAGMQALAKAGREGKSLKPVKAKYNKYN